MRLSLLGSAIVMTYASGNVAEGPYTYSPYGEPDVTAGTPWRYTGRYLDAETDLYYYRARYYSSVKRSLGAISRTSPAG